MFERSLESGRRATLLSVVRGEPPRAHSLDHLLSLGVLPSVAGVCFENALDFTFDVPQNQNHYDNTNSCTSTVAVAPGVITVDVISVEQVLGDGVRVQPTDGRIGVDELWRAFQCWSRVDARLLTEEWFRMQYRMIVWKLAALECCWPLHFARRYTRLLC